LSGRFVLRRLAVAIVAASLLGVVLASPIAADTGPNRDRFEFDRVQAAFDFSEGGRDFTGQVLIDRDSETGASIASFFFSSGPIVTCDNGTPDDPSDDFEGQDLIDFTANEEPPTTLLIESHLSAASASATAIGDRIHLEACTGAETSSTETVEWQLEMHATGPADRTTQVDRFPNDDGTMTIQSVKIAQRPAAGSITIDGMTLDLRDASLQHILVVASTV
jgi:hypothetical protein